MRNGRCCGGSPPSRGGATVEAAEAACVGGPVEQFEVLDLITSLVDKSLLVTDGDGRYRMLETIKAYGLERLAEAGEREPVRRAHAAYFTGLARTADPYLRRAEQLEWLARLTVEHDNLNAALRGAIAAGDARAAVRLVAAAGWYWWISGHKAEGAELAARALAVATPKPDQGPDQGPGQGPGDEEPEEEALAVACALAVLFATAGLGDDRRTGDLLRRAVVLAERTGTRHPVVGFVAPMERLLLSAAAGEPAPLDAWDGVLADEDPWLRAQGRLESARTLLAAGGPPAAAEASAEEALAGFRGIGERWGTSFALTVLADLVARRGDFAAAIGHYRQAAAVIGEMGVVEDRLYAQVRQAQLSWLAGDAAAGEAALAQAERDAEAAGWPEAIAATAHGRAELARWRGESAVARAGLDRVQEALREVAVHDAFRAMVLDSLAHLDAADGHLEAARARRAEALEMAVGTMHAPTVAQMLVGVADQAVRLDRPEEAARLLAAALAVRGGPDLSLTDAGRVEEAARATLGAAYEQHAGHGEPDGSDGPGLTMEAVRELARVTLGG
ncbi:hypothetical protein Sxan_60920 [Streptomyces xanthophaeus]|uniref:Uncharacterized protein n=1 Tax=Streptomyces xanthophaeus TaxID=67385 RepID=A0A919LBX4_9ACTN|nr:hypothetical protein Sxan_60920 [Streptomyces xanthophaeus]